MFLFKTFIWILSASFGFGTLMLLFFHITSLINKNNTTIEFCETKYDKNFYDRGLAKNWIGILGKNPIFWVLPFGTKTH